MEPSSISSAAEAADGSVLEGARQLGGLASGLYGPGGRDKLVVTGGEAVVTNDLHQLFDLLDIDHPGARIAANGAVQQKETVGDGSTAVVLLTGALAARADELLAKGMHRASIAAGFHRAQRAAETATADLGAPVDGLDDARSRAAIRAALGRAAEMEASLETVIEAARLVREARQSGPDGTGIDHVEFHHRADARAPRVALCRGVFIEREPVTPNTPRSFENARIAVIGGAKKAGRGIEERELKRAGGSEGKGRTEVTLTADTPEELTAFRQREADEVASQVQRLADADVDVVFTAMGISDRAIAALDRAGITAFRGLQAEQARRVARTTGARIVMHLEDFGTDDVGTAGRVRVESGDDIHVRLDRCPASQVATLLVTGSTDAGATSLQRALMTGIVTGRTILGGARVVPGGGGIWMRLAAEVREARNEVADRSAVAMDAYADALEDLARALVRNSGADAIDTLAAMRAGGPNAVFDAETKSVRDAGDRGPFDLATVVEHAVTTASEVAVQLVRIDDRLPAATGSDEDADDYDFQPDPERDVA